eukprot:7329665-Lingulodinium_polyedra.AAC.1
MPPQLRTAQRPRSPHSLPSRPWAGAQPPTSTPLAPQTPASAASPRRRRPPPRQAPPPRAGAR